MEKIEWNRSDKGRIKDILSETRAKIIKILIKTPTYVNQLTREVGVTSRAIEWAIDGLQKVGLVECRRGLGKGPANIFYVTKYLTDNLETYNKLLRLKRLGEYMIGGKRQGQEIDSA